MEAIANKKYMVGDRVIADGKKSVILELRRTCVQVEPSFDLVEYGDIQPIPFAEEIFEKNQFQRNTFNGTIIYTKHSSADIHWYDVIVEIGKDSEGIQRWDCVCIKICKAGANLTLNNQSYFHQLQHALLLVGLNEVSDNLKV